MISRRLLYRIGHHIIGRSWPLERMKALGCGGPALDALWVRALLPREPAPQDSLVLALADDTEELLRLLEADDPSAINRARCAAILACVDHGSRGGRHGPNGSKHMREIITALTASMDLSQQISVEERYLQGLVRAEPAVVFPLARRMSQRKLWATPGHVAALLQSPRSLVYAFTGGPAHD